MRTFVLIVDDNAMNAKLIRALLENENYDTEWAANADEARRAAAKRTPNLVLMDLQMPGVDGYTLTQEFRRQEALKEVPIVAVTAAAMRGDEQRALAVGCDGYVSKPIDTRTFVRTVSEFMKTAS